MNAKTISWEFFQILLPQLKKLTSYFNRQKISAFTKKGRTLVCVVRSFLHQTRGCRGRCIINKVESSNLAHDEVYLMQHYVIKFVSDLRQVVGFLRVLRFPLKYKTDRHDMTEILLKVALNIITLTLTLPLYQTQLSYSSIMFNTRHYTPTADLAMTNCVVL